MIRRGRLRVRRPIEGHDWNHEAAIRKALDWPFEGLLFDVLVIRSFLRGTSVMLARLLASHIASRFQLVDNSPLLECRRPGMMVQFTKHEGDQRHGARATASELRKVERTGVYGHCLVDNWVDISAIPFNNSLERTVESGEKTLDLNSGRSPGRSARAR